MCAPSPPSYASQIDTQNELTSRQMDLAESQYADQKALVDKYLPLFEQQAQLNLTEQQKTGERADTQWANYTENFMPLEQEFAKQAADYNTVGRQTQDAQRAQAEVASQFDQQQAAQAEQMAAAGVMPGDGRALSLQNATGIEKAKALASAGNDARRKTEATGLSLMNSAIGVGRNQVTGGLQAADLALRQGSAAQGSAGGAINAGGIPAAGASSIYGAAGAANQGAANIMNTQFQNGLASTSANNSMFGDVLGAGAMIYGMSSKTLKDVGEDVQGASDAVEASPAKHWAYKRSLAEAGLKDGPSMGPMAEDLQKATGGAVSDGMKVDLLSLGGLHHGAIGEHAERLRKIEKKLGLADAKPRKQPQRAEA